MTAEDRAEESAGPPAATEGSRNPPAATEESTNPPAATEESTNPPATTEESPSPPATTGDPTGPRPTEDGSATQAGAGPAARPPRAVDASMDLLNQILRQPIDPDYATRPARPASRLHWRFAVVAALAGLLLAISALQTTRSAPALEIERTELVNRIQAGEQEQDRLRDQAAQLQAQIADLRAKALAADSGSTELVDRIAQLEPAVGTVAVHGDGVVVVVDDAPDAGTGDTRDRVLDLDLQILVNGLWQAGAEAIAVNGHRLSALTAIRSAGDAITVDYRSVTRPYRVEAIGDPRTLQARFVESSGGAWWNELAGNRRMRFEVGTVNGLTLAADPGMELRHAKEAGE